MNTNKTKKLVLGAMIAAIYGMLALLNTYTGGLFDLFICYAMVSSIAWYGVRYSLKENLIVVLVSMIVIVMVGTPFFALSALACCLAGVVMGECLKRKTSKSILMIGVFVVCLINNLLIYEVFNGLLGIDLVAEVTLMVEQLSAFLPVISLELAVDLIPLVLVIMSIMEMYLIVMINQIILKRLRIDFPSQFHIALMHLSKKTGIVLLISVIVSYICYYVLDLSHYFLYIFVLSFLTISLQGFSLLNFVLIVTKRHMFSILLFISFLIPMMYIIFFVLGIIDIFSDLRKNILYNNVNVEE